ncbi:MAG TPA: DUF4136 domain-containing protein [Candidatus Eisenbacteria bacterium]|nr:DUF4136 domain-containing protein [Candidatus Eisenbacteria bacterium]
MPSAQLRLSLTSLLLCALVVLSGAPAHAQKIKVEYDKSIDFTKFKTYAIDPKENAPRPMLRLAIQAAVQDDLGKRGLTKVASDPDLYVQMYGAIDSDAAFNYTDPIYGSGIPPLNYGITLWYDIPGTVTTVVVHKGQMVVDIIDARHKKLIWRGIAQQKLSSDNREKLLDQVNTAVEKMFARYPVAKKWS